MAKYLNATNQKKIMQELIALHHGGSTSFSIPEMRSVMIRIMECGHIATLTLMLRNLHFSGYLEKADNFRFRVSNAGYLKYEPPQNTL